MNNIFAIVNTCPELSVALLLVIIAIIAVSWIKDAEAQLAVGAGSVLVGIVALSITLGKMV